VKDSIRQTLRDVLVFALLIGIGVAGRWAQPEWCITPMAAVAVFAGFYFSRIGVALLVPLAVLAITDLKLPAYGGAATMLVTYAAMCLPVFFGQLLRGNHSIWNAAWRWAVCGLIPATLFYLITNFAVWAFESIYPRTWAGLVECYWAAVPFYRWMAAGDVFYLAVMFGCWALAGARVPSLQRARSTSCNHVLGDRDSDDAPAGNPPSSARLVRMH
jgi:hypothetical protein